MSSSGPARLAVVHGHHRRNAPQVDTTAPTLPVVREGLPEPVAAEFARLLGLLVARGVRLEAGDAPAMELTAGALVEYAEARDFLAENGSTYEAPTESGTTMHREYPQVRIAADAWRRAIAGLKLFGLSPADRTRVQIAPRGDPAAEARRARFLGITVGGGA